MIQVFSVFIKRQRKPKGQSRIDNPETQDTERRQTKQKQAKHNTAQKTAKNPQKTWSEPRCSPRIKVHPSDKRVVMLFIYIVR